MTSIYVSIFYIVRGALLTGKVEKLRRDLELSKYDLEIFKSYDD